MHPRPPRIWTHKHATIVGRHSPHNNNKNPSARLRLAARHIMSSRSLGRDSAGDPTWLQPRERLHKSLGRCGLLRRRVARSFRSSPPTSRRPSTFSPPSSARLSSSLSLLSLIPFAVCSISLLSHPSHSPAFAAYPNVAPFPGAHVHAGGLAEIFRLVVGFDSLPACVQLANKLNPVVSFRLYIEMHARARARANVEKRGTPFSPVLADWHDRYSEHFVRVQRVKYLRLEYFAQSR